MYKSNLVRNAHVEVKRVSSGTGKNRVTEAEIVVDNKFMHRFDSRSRISKHLDLMDEKTLSERLTGGSYFFVNNGREDTMVDFRDGSYNGFVHTDQTIAKFMELFGVQPEQALPLHRRGRHNADDSKLVLRKEWSNHDIVVPGFAEGGRFNSRLSFVWSPFRKTVNSAFDLVRLICTNGAIGLTSFLNTKIPLVNRWEEHLDIASRQIQNKVNSVVTERVATMSNTNASVGDCLLLEQHAFNRLYSPTAKTNEEREKLLALMTAASAQVHLSTVYKDEVFINKALAAQLPSHLTMFDVWNIATEMRTHTGSCLKSSSHALDQIANGMMFDDDANLKASSSRFLQPARSSFSDPDRAFFGVME